MQLQSILDSRFSILDYDEASFRVLFEAGSSWLNGQRNALDSLREECVRKLKDAMQSFVSNTAQPTLRYDETWGGAVSNAG